MGDGALGIAGNGLVDPGDPFRRVEPAVAQLDQPAGGFGDGDGARVVRVVAGDGGVLGSLAAALTKTAGFSAESKRGRMSWVVSNTFNRSRGLNLVIRFQNLVSLVFVRTSVLVG